MSLKKALLSLAGGLACQAALAQRPAQPAARAGNPVFPGWYADPEAAIFGSQYWIYPTYSAPFNEQVYLDAFSSPDLVHWTKHPRIIDTAAVKWAHRALWAPAIVAKGGKYYLFFGANDYHPEKPNEPPGGIGVAVADQPAGPFKDLLGHPLVGTIENGAQPIDQFVFRDGDGKYYLLYGGWQHCNIAQLKDDFTGFVPFPDGTTFKSITPEKYVEGPLMFRRQGKYYFMWSEGGWTGPDYSVAYAVGSSPFGPFRREGKILQQDLKVGTGAGHHSILNVPGTDRWYIVYHRHPLGDPDGNHRVVCIDELHFDKQGHILPVKITTQGVAAQPLKPAATSR
ncbi:family 43 glycosylhydrolase [Hymenobacter sp. BRD128]|uniref:glycoside hydrolase family 43 protein n=1 Tax=Hymenobacter sp. BRD128 TaxID=2675878 RepID=UPI001564B0DA|nr:glycoside hydrolase family 43 protein [Hymenobacter sp. BRD128]QKG56110.1 family 43 glycosylhydrolase [Hymenobacter sp. BRD128]